MTAQESLEAEAEARRLEEQMRKRMTLLKAQRAFADDHGKAAHMIQVAFRRARGLLKVRVS